MKTNEVFNYIKEETLAMYSDAENMFDKDIPLDTDKDDLFEIILKDKSFLKHFVECVESDMKIIKDISEPELFHTMSEAVKILKKRL